MLSDGTTTLYRIRQQLLHRLKSDVQLRLSTTLHELIKLDLQIDLQVDLQTEEQWRSIGKFPQQLVAADPPEMTAAQSEQSILNQPPPSFNETAHETTHETTHEITNFAKQRLLQQRDRFQAEWDIRNEKLTKLRQALAIEAGAAIQFQLSKQIAAEEIELAHLEERLRQTEQELSVATSAKVVLNRAFQSLGSIASPVALPIAPPVALPIAPPVAPLTALEPTHPIVEIFDRPDVQGKLLILGEPGAGKTTELLTLAQDLLGRAEAIETAAIPVIFELSAWQEGQPLEHWLVAQLQDLYKISAAIAHQLVTRQWVLPLLDGLDELGLVRQQKCIASINRFLEDTAWTQLVVCCRREEYEQGQVQIDRLHGAVYLQPLTDEQIQVYFQRLRRSSIWQMVQQTPELLELARYPLFLTMLVYAYQGRVIRTSQELLDYYVVQHLEVVQRLDTVRSQGVYPAREAFSPHQTRHYLAWLAQKMLAQSQTEFLIEEIQPTWLSSRQQRLYRSMAGATIGLLTGISSGLTTSNWSVWVTYGACGGLSGAFIYGLSSNSSATTPRLERSRSSSRTVKNLMAGLLLGLIFGTMTGLSGALISGVGSNEPLVGFLRAGGFFGLKAGFAFGLVHALGGGVSKTIQPIDRLKWSWRKAAIGLSRGFASGLVFGLCLGLLIVGIVGLKFDLRIYLKFILSFSLHFGLIFSPFGALFDGLSGLAIAIKTTPNQGIWQSAINAGIAGLVVSAASSLLAVGFLGLSDRGMMLGVEVMAGVICFLVRGGAVVIQHVTLRLMLYRQGNIPWNYARFLDQAVKHRFIQRIGGRYRFTHDLLRKHFAQISQIV